MKTLHNRANSTIGPEPVFTTNRRPLSGFRISWQRFVTRFFAQFRPERRRRIPVSVTSAKCVQPLEDRTLLSTITPIVSAPDGSAGSLRDAIHQANSNAEDDVIQLAAGAWEIRIANVLGAQENENLTGDLDLTEAGQTIIFEGAGPGETIIDASSLDRAFHLSGNVTAVFRNLTIRRGFARDNGFDGTLPDERTALGGAILSEGGHVVLENVVLTSNTAFGADGQPGRDGQRAYGGAVAVLDGTLTVTDSSLHNNLARGGLGGVGLPGQNGTEGGPDGEQGQAGGRGGDAFGGAIYGKEAAATVSNSDFTSNRAQGGRGGEGGEGGAGAAGGDGGEGGNGGDGGYASGGVVYIDSGSLIAADSDFADNSAIGGDSGPGRRGGTGGTSTGSGGAPRGGLGGSSSVGGLAHGGAISVALGNISLTGSSVLSNRATGGNGERGGVGGQGGAGSGGDGRGGNGGNGGQGGVAQGGGIFSLRGNLSVTDSTIANNELQGGHAGIGGPGGRAGDSRGGSAGADGGNGGLGGRGGDAQGGGAFALNVDVVSTNTTVSANRTTRGEGAAGGDQGTASGEGASGRVGRDGRNGVSEGGGLYFNDSSSGLIQSTTIALNEVTDGQGAGVYSDGSMQVELHNVLIGANVDDLDYEGQISPRSTYNIIGNGSRQVGLSDGVDSNQLGHATGVLNIGIAGLSDNGGPTLTHALLETSPAIDAGDRSRAPLFDQRGVLRPVQSAVDVGAFEAQRTLTVALPEGGGDYRVIGDAADLLIRRETGEEVFRYEYTALRQIILVSSTATDNVSIDFSATDVVPQGGLILRGTEGGEDSLRLEGSMLSEVSYTLSGPGSGTIATDSGRVLYENVLNVSDTLSSTSRTIQFGNDADTATVAAAPVAGQMRLIHGTANLDFANPESTLTVNLGGGDDSLTMALPDGSYRAGTVINAQDGSDLVDAEFFARRVTMSGGAGNDSLWGGDLPDFLDGGIGDDQIKGNSGGDRVFGGEGRDTAFGGFGRDTMYGGAGNDLLLGEYDADVLFGEDGDDNVRGQGGSGDRVSGGDGDDTAAGGSGNDVLVESGDFNFRLTRSRLLGRGNDLAITNEFALITGGDGNNLLDGRSAQGIGVWFRGGGGNDTIFGSAGRDDLRGDAGNDLIIAGVGNDVVFGGDGNDDLRGEAGADVISGDDGDDLVDGGSDDDVLNGNSGSDSLRGTGGDDVLNGGEGDDELRGGDGADSLNGGAGQDELLGEADADVISGGDGDDRATGGDGDDLIGGDAGNDRIFGGAGSDRLSGGTGGDNIHGGPGADIIHGDDGSDWLFGNEDADSLYGGQGRDGLVGDAGNDFLLGDEDEDSLSGGAGNDALLGSGGDDLLIGGDGEDILRGQGGTDILSGGDGIDQLLEIEADVIDETAILRASFSADSGLLTILTPANAVVTVDEHLGRTRVLFDGVVVNEVFDIAPSAVTGLLVRGSSGNDNVDLTEVTREMFTAMTDDGVVVLGEDSDDVLIGSEFKDLIDGGAGNDLIRGGKDQDTARGGDGDDSLFGEAESDQLMGDAGNDYLDGGDNPDHLEGGDGDDILRGRSGRDSLFGGNGNDGLAGHRGNDLLDGGFGNDTLLGGDNDDALFGGAGDDIVIGEFGRDRVKGNGGNDLLAGGHGYGQPDAGDVIIGSAVEIDEFFEFEAPWTEDV